MPADISILVKNPRWKTLLRPYCKTIENACNAALAGSHHRNETLAVVLADDKFVQVLNRDFRGRNKPTNVLSFPGEGEHLGDIVLALATIEREAKEQRKTVKAHATHLLVHGVLHLLGFDHMRDREAEKMEAEEIKILEKLGLKNPYL